MHCPGGNATEPIWTVLASSDGISSWTPLKPQHSNPNLLTSQLWCFDFLTPPAPLTIPHRLPAFLESLMPFKNWCFVMQDGQKAFWSIPYVSLAFFPSLNRILPHIILLKCPHVQILFWKFTSWDNKALVWCIPIAAVAVHLELNRLKFRVYILLTSFPKQDENTESSLLSIHCW